MHLTCRKNVNCRTVAKVIVRLAVTFAALAPAVPFEADAQAKVGLARIGVIATGSADQSAPFLDVFRQRLRELGNVEGRNIAIDVRYSSGGDAAYRDAAAEFVALNVDIIVAFNSAATRAARQQTTTIPIVMAGVGDAVASGFVKSLARPGGNVTGQSFLGPDLNLKSFDLLTEALPRAKRVGLLYDPELVSRDPPDFRPIRDAAQAKGVTLLPVRLPRSGGLASALATVGEPLPSALLVVAVSVVEQTRIANFAAKHRIAAICSFREAIDAGALMSYGPNFFELWRGAATYVDKILKGAKPADLPVEQPTSFELVVNLKNAKALGITLPASVLTRANHVVQ